MKKVTYLACRNNVQAHESKLQEIETSEMSDISNGP